MSCSDEYEGAGQTEDFEADPDGCLEAWIEDHREEWADVFAAEWRPDVSGGQWSQLLVEADELGLEVSVNDDRPAIVISRNQGGGWETFVVLEDDGQIWICETEERVPFVGQLADVADVL